MRVIAAAVTIFILFTLAWNTKAFQKYFFPEKYWQNQVLSIESDIKVFEDLIHDQQLELFRLAKDGPAEINRARLYLIKDKRYKDDAAKLSAEYVRSRIDTVRDTIEFLKEILADKKLEYKTAKRTLKQAQD